MRNLILLNHKWTCSQKIFVDIAVQNGILKKELSEKISVPHLILLCFRWQKWTSSVLTQEETESNRTWWILVKT